MLIILWFTGLMLVSGGLFGAALARSQLLLSIILIMIGLLFLPDQNFSSEILGEGLGLQRKEARFLFSGIFLFSVPLGIILGRKLFRQEVHTT